MKIYKTWKKIVLKVWNFHEWCDVEIKLTPKGRNQFLRLFLILGQVP
jgi:hypothetical protein